MKLETWIASNKPPLNISKKKCMIFCKRQFKENFQMVSATITLYDEG